MIKPLFLLFSLICFYFQGGAQTTPSNYASYGIMQYFVIPPFDFNEIPCGIKYLNQSFQEGKIVMQNNFELSSIGLRYNIAKDEMECEVNKQHSRITAPEKIKMLDIKGAIFEYKKFLIKKDSLSGYLCKIFGGSKNLYAKYYLKSTNWKNSEFKVNTEYFIESGSNLPIKISSIKSIVPLFYENLQQQATKFTNSNHLDLDQTKDLVKLLTYLDNLAKESVTSR